MNTQLILINDFYIQYIVHTLFSYWTNESIQ